MAIDFETSIIILQRAWRQKTTEEKAVFCLELYSECGECGVMFPSTRLRMDLLCYPCHFYYKYS